MATFSVILAAAGKSSRFRDKHYKKPFAPLADRAVWLHSAERFLNRDDVKQLILVISPEDREAFDSKFAANVAILGIEVVEGGPSGAIRSPMPWRGSRDDVDFVAIHDAARPCLANEWIDKVVAAAEQSGAAILAIPVTGTLKRVGRRQDGSTRPCPRTNLWEAQTPQVFRRQLLLDAYAQRGDYAATDDAELVERLGHSVTHRPRLADQHEDHHPRRPAVGARRRSRRFPNRRSWAQLIRSPTTTCGGERDRAISGSMRQTGASVERCRTVGLGTTAAGTTVRSSDSH